MKYTPGFHFQQQQSGLMTEPPRAAKKREEKAPSSECGRLRGAVLGAGGGHRAGSGEAGDRGMRGVTVCSGPDLAFTSALC